MTTSIRDCTQYKHLGVCLLISGDLILPCKLTMKLGVVMSEWCQSRIKKNNVNVILKFINLKI